MHKNTLFPAVALALLLAAGTGCNKAGKLAQPSTFKTPTGPVELKIKWTPGERVVQDMDMKMNTEMTVPGQPAPMRQTMTMGQKFALNVVKTDPDGGHEVELEFLSARMGMKMGDKTMMDYDSTKPAADTANPMANVFGKIIGSKITYVMDAGNNVDHIDGVDALVDRMTQGSNARAAAPIRGMLNQGYLKQMMSSNRLLPTNAVSPGDSWPVSMEFPMAPFGTFVLAYTITLQGWEMHGARNCARMDIQGTIQTKPDASPNPADMDMTIKDGTVSGTTWFDPELGINIDTLMNQDMTINMTLPANPRARQGAANQPQSISGKMSQVLSIKLDSLN